MIDRPSGARSLDHRGDRERRARVQQRRAARHHQPRFFGGRDDLQLDADPARSVFELTADSRSFKVIEGTGGVHVHQPLDELQQVIGGVGRRVGADPLE